MKEKLNNRRVYTSKKAAPELFKAITNGKMCVSILTDDLIDLLTVKVTIFEEQNVAKGHHEKVATNEKEVGSCKELGLPL